MDNDPSHLNPTAVCAASITVLIVCGKVLFPAWAARIEQLNPAVPSLTIAALAVGVSVHNFIATRRAKQAKPEHHANHRPDPH